MDVGVLGSKSRVRVRVGSRSERLMEIRGRSGRLMMIRGRSGRFVIRGMLEGKDCSSDCFSDWAMASEWACVSVSVGVGQW